MSGNDEYIIRRTESKEDFAVCAKLMAKTDPWITLQMDYNECLPAFGGLCKEIFVLEIQSEIAGFVILQVCGTFSGYIQTICIDEKYRGKGLGTLLLEFCEKRILEFSPNIFICVSSFNSGAIKLYEKFGFKQVGILENFVKKGFDELLMRKTFGARAGYKQK
ncbi:MAG: N-acetyltransferase [Bacteroidales bacterium]